MQDCIVVTYKELPDETKVRLKIRGRCEFEVIPVPTEISVTCGIAHRFYKEDFDRARTVIEKRIADGDIPSDNVHYYVEYYENNNVFYKPLVD